MQSFLYALIVPAGVLSVIFLLVVFPTLSPSMSIPFGITIILILLGALIKVIYDTLKGGKNE